MRNFFTALALSAIGVLNAQVFSENFDGGVPGGMTQTTINGSVSWTGCGGNTDGAPCPITGSGSATFFNASYTAFSTALNTPVMDLSSGVYKVTFTHAKRSWSGDINELHVDISTNGGTSWTTMESYLEEAYDPTENSITLSPYSPTSTTMVRFRAVNHYGYRLILDDIVVSEVTTDDIQMTNIDVSSILPQGNVEVKGSLKNEGLNNLTSFDLNWQVGSGTVYTQNYTGQSITPGQTFNFTHADSWTATPGAYDLKVWVSNTNVTDVNASNDELTKTVSIASNSTRKVPMYEKFSSSTCPPCYGFNTNAFNPFFDSYGHDKSTFISYQVNWPGAGDPYYTAEVGTRVSYYGISAAPSLLLNSIGIGIPTQAQLVTILDDFIENDGVGFFDVESDHTITGNNIEVTIDIMPYLTGNFVVQAMVIEKITTGNVANNGETEFHHVFMKALPNAAGTTMSFVHDQAETLTLSADLSTTNVEEMDDLAVVVFIQDPATKQIMQSAYTDASGIILGLDEMAKVSATLVPNPTTGIVNVITDKAVNIQIFDMAGKNVFNQSDVANKSSLNLSHLGKGVYVVQMKGADGTSTTKKLIIK